MRGKRLWLLMIIATIAVIVFALWLVQNVRERHKAAEREAKYQTVLAKYTGELKPGMTREQVEQHLQTAGTQFRQMCCVANFRGHYVSLVGAGWDDLVKIGEESAPWFCSENNVYIAFEFSPKSKGEVADTSGSDILKGVSVFHQLEGCL
jgi:K+-sensing histidine kinase KdpD